MVKAFNRDEVRSITIKPSIDCTGRIIHAHAWLDNKRVKQLNQVPVDLPKRKVTVSIHNPNADKTQLTMKVYGRTINSEKFIDLVALRVVSAVTGSSQEVIEFESSLFSSFKIATESTEKLTTEISIEEVARNIPQGAITGVAEGAPLSVPCNFFDLPSSDRYSIVFHGEGVGVVSTERLLIYDNDGKLRLEEQHD